MNTQFFTNNGNQKFPLSTEALNFIQEQIKLVYGLTNLAGENIIVRQSSATETGLVVFDGELLPLTGSPSQYITIAESTEQMTVEGKFVGNVRIIRTATYTLTKSDSVTTKESDAFRIVKSIATLMSELEAAKQHHVPTGAIMMWSGAINAIPAGWALCDGTNKTPNLSGRFIVGVGKSSNGETDYQLNKTGGKEKVLLTANECALPEHRHGLDPQTIKYGGTKTVTVATTYGTGGSSGSEYSTYYEKQLADSPHNNIPPYYVLAYIIKII